MAKASNLELRLQPWRVPSRLSVVWPSLGMMVTHVATVHQALAEAQLTEHADVDFCRPYRGLKKSSRLSSEFVGYPYPFL